MNNKISIILLIFLCLTSCAKKKGTAKISGEIQGLASGEMYLYGQDGSFDKIDTIRVRNGEFNTRIDIDTLSAVYLLINNSTEYPIFIDKGDHIKIKGDVSLLQRLSVRGNDLDDDFMDFKKSLAKDGDIDRLNFGSTAQDPSLQPKAQEFISKHNGSLVSAYLLDRFFMTQPMPDYPRIKQIIASLDRSLRDSPRIAKISDYISRWEKSRMGAMAPSFSLPDSKGTYTTRTSEMLRNKYILLSFWASWAGNRAQSAAEMRQLYRSFRSNGKLALVGVSLDTDKGEWLRSIKQDSLQGVQLSDLNGFNSPIVSEFAISSLPAYFLIAPDGVILARDMIGEALRRQIAAALR